MEKHSKEALPKKSGLSKNMKIGLTLGAFAAVLIIAFFMLSGGEDNVGAFTDYLYNSPKSAIIMDLRGSPGGQANSNILQCGVNLISGGFFASENKDLLVYACDEKGCMAANTSISDDETSSLSGEAATENKTIDASGNSTMEEKAEPQYISFDQALYNMRSRAYFHILYGEGKKEFFPNHVEVFMNETTDPANCDLKIR
ncbi:hypothetical protein COU37_00035 [Candidatus Micrarchaeota archaeon CG10_big_fil_rev_8_21_14_0_10_45_29]|nr:MAG: hypothetical protein COU37_00035 [Candidatus Micrarchaeota archaeon CG10_big_fil_rev_8_21_14_0_10_45_29]